MATTVALTLPQNYGYVLFVATGATLVSLWHGMRIGGFRKAAKVSYPNAYATANEAETSMEKYQFNCAQRAHGNFMENYLDFLVTLGIGGLKFPEWSAGLGVVFLVGRVLYATGYTRAVRDGGRGRYNGMIQYIPRLGLLGLSFASSYQLLV